ncbi:hypothetical protein [Allokutzneria multivorans]|uniref:hypothetical protein n=1 Tax=Allokutzneria multivorans TaxID=1142134 RepID=UPI0031E6B1C5
MLTTLNISPGVASRRVTGAASPGESLSSHRATHADLVDVRQIHDAASLFGYRHAADDDDFPFWIKESERVRGRWR